MSGEDASFSAAIATAIIHVINSVLNESFNIRAHGMEIVFRPLDTANFSRAHLHPFHIVQPRSSCLTFSLISCMHVDNQSRVFSASALKIYTVVLHVLVLRAPEMEHNRNQTRPLPAMKFRPCFLLATFSYFNATLCVRQAPRTDKLW